MWDPDIYLAFGDLRTRPALELASRCGQVGDGLIYDLGCGPGNSTQILASLFPQARLVGVDSSVDMLDRARQEGPSGADWVQADLNNWAAPVRAELIFSNATYQWLDGHDQLFPALLGGLRPGGRLAIQMPQNFAAPSHVLMRKIASDGLFRDKLQDLLRHDPVGSRQDYYDLLAPRAASIDIWETEYAQILEGDDPVFDWVSGTALRPLMGALNEEEQSQFASAYKSALRKAYPKRADGKTLFPFRRIFMVVEV